MINKPQDDLWESILKAAIIENNLEETLDYPSIQDLHHLTLPQNYEQNIKQFIKQLQRKALFRNAIKYIGKIASTIVIILGISFAIMLCNPQVRAACRDVIVTIFEKYVHFDFTSNSSLVQDLNITLNYLPENFFLADTQTTPNSILCEYQNNHGDTLSVSFFPNKISLYMDQEHYSLFDVWIHDMPGTYFESTNPNFPNGLVWKTKQGLYRLLSSLEKDVLIKIAENIK